MGTIEMDSIYTKLTVFIQHIIYIVISLVHPLCCLFVWRHLWLILWMCLFYPLQEAARAATPVSTLAASTRQRMTTPGSSQQGATERLSSSSVCCRTPSGSSWPTLTTRSWWLTSYQSGEQQMCQHVHTHTHTHYTRPLTYMHAHTHTYTHMCAHTPMRKTYVTQEWKLNQAD